MKHLIQQDKCLVIGNVWDSLSAIIHEQAGFKALGTTSWGISNTLGYKDGQTISFDDLKSVVLQILKVVNIPLSVDIEAGYASDNQQIVDNILTLAKMGCAGVNLEDANPNQGLKDKNEFALLVKQIKTALLEDGFDNFYLNIRTDTYLNLDNPLPETLERAKLYQDNGADGIFVPCIQTDEDIQAVVSAIDIPLNVMSLPNLTDIKKLTDLGVKRFSYGNAMSDCIIAEIEKLTRAIISNNQTACLYEHDALITKFK